jgi:hypothetical protein
MAVIFANSVTEVPGTGVTTDLYTCPAGRQAMIQAVRCQNENAGASELRLIFTPLSGTPIVVAAEEAAAESAMALPAEKLVLKSGDRLRAESESEDLLLAVFAVEQG